jgi:hypothetical protein
VISPKTITMLSLVAVSHATWQSKGCAVRAAARRRWRCGAEWHRSPH